MPVVRQPLSCACGDHVFVRTTKHGVALTDPADVGVLARPWALLPGGYAFAKAEGNKTILLHRVIAEAGRGEWVDHANGDRLDNRRANLRKCSPSQNNRNSKPKGGGASQFKGVSRAHGDKWEARIRTDSGRLRLGTFETAEEAAHAYNAAATIYHGEFARLNRAS